MSPALPLSTGQVAQLLRCTEPQLAELVRRGRIHPPPAIFAGRRLWEEHHVRKAAELLGYSEDDVVARLRRAEQERAAVAGPGQ